MGVQGGGCVMYNGKCKRGFIPAWSGSEKCALSLPNEVVRNWTQREEKRKGEGGGETHINLTMTNVGSFVSELH